MMKRYLFLLSTLTLLLCLAVGVINYRVDPYVFYHYDEADTDALSRIEQFYHMRVTKPWYLSRLSPARVVVGTSRTARISPHPVWPQDDSYNLSVPGLTPYEMLRFVEHAHASGPLDDLMIGLDFNAMVRPEPRTQSGFEESRLLRDARTASGFIAMWQRIGDVTDTLFSMPALKRSFSAVTGAAQPRRRYFKDGTWDTESEQFVGKSGYALTGRVTIYQPRNAPADLDQNFEYLAQTLRFAHQNNIDTRLVITPIHVFMVELWRRVGYGDRWEKFHNRLVQLNAEVALEYEKAPFPVYAFNHVRGVVDEPIRKGSDNEHAVFDDGLHFRKHFGGEIMSSVWGGNQGLAYVLDPETVYDYLGRVDQLRRDFQAEHAELVEELMSNIAPELGRDP